MNLSYQNKIVRNTFRVSLFLFLVLAIFSLITMPAYAADRELSTIQSVIYYVVTAIGAFFARIGAWLLDASISLFVVNMAEFSDNRGLTQAVEALWAVVRDIFNLLFIFGVIWAGFKTILSSDDSQTKRLLGGIIVAAVLINFSLYFVRVIIDFNNFLAYQVSELMVANQYPDTILGIPINRISSGFIAATSLNNFPENSGSVAEELTDPSEYADSSVESDADIGWSIVVLAFFVMAMLIAMGFIFAAGSLILFTRFMYLTFLMIFAPVIFLGLIFPQLAGRGGNYFKKLINQSLIAPAYIFMLYLSLYALQSFSNVQGGYSFWGSIIYFMVVMGFAYASLMVAKSLGAVGADYGMNMVKKGTGAVTGGLTAGLAAYGLRKGAGAVLEKMDKSGARGKLRDIGSVEGAEKYGKFKSFMARRALEAADKAGNVSYDVRQAPGAKRVSQALNLGEGSKIGYVQQKEELAKKEKAYTERIFGKVDDDDETVLRLRAEQDALEAKIDADKKKARKLQKDKSQTGDADEQRMYQAQIDDLKAGIEADTEALAKQKEAVSREMHRYQIGTERNVDQTLLDDIKDDKDKLKEKMVAFAAMDKKDPARDTKMDEIMADKKKLADKEKEAAKQAGGYAGVVEGMSWLQNLFTGRTAALNENAGDAIRKEAKSKIKGG